MYVLLTSGRVEWAYTDEDKVLAFDLSKWRLFLLRGMFWHSRAGATTRFFAGVALLLAQNDK